MRKFVVFAGSFLAVAGVALSVALGTQSVPGGARDRAVVPSSVADSDEVVMIRLPDGSLVQGCPIDSEWTQITWDYNATSDGGTRDDPLSPYAEVGRDLPYKSELIQVGNALVRPNEQGKGNDVVYALAEFADGTFVVESVSFCNPLGPDGKAVQRDEFQIADEARPG